MAGLIIQQIESYVIQGAPLLKPIPMVPIQTGSAQDKLKSLTLCAMAPQIGSDLVLFLLWCDEICKIPAHQT